ncbi:MAG: DMT family transporter [Acidobacteriia bacterium]|nr:DMT family transporter [Terriglobia bacterium]
MAIEISLQGSVVKSGPRWTLYALLVLMELFWSLHYVASKYALREFEPLVLASLRIGAATLILGLISAVTGNGGTARNSNTSRPRILFLQLGLFGTALNQLFFILGLSKSLASHSALVISISPVFVLIIARLKGMEHLARFRVAGMAISIFGVIALNLKEGFHLQTEYFLGDLITMAGILSFSYYTIISKDIARHYGLIRATFATYLGGALFLIPAGVLGWHRQPWGQVSWRGIAALGYMVLFGSIVAYLIFFYALRHAEASRVASYAYLQPVMASAFSITFLGERLTLSLVAGIFIILTGVLIAEHGREVFDWLV